MSRETEGLGPSCTLLETLYTLPHMPPQVPPDKVRNRTSKLSTLLRELGGALGRLEIPRRNWLRKAWITIIGTHKKE